jgi:hypothetical protein
LSRRGKVLSAGWQRLYRCMGCLQGALTRTLTARRPLQPRLAEQIRHFPASNGHILLCKQDRCERAVAAAPATLLDLRQASGIAPGEHAADKPACLEIPAQEPDLGELATYDVCSGGVA